MATPEPKLLEYIKASLSRGKTKEEIYQELLGQGWTLEGIQAGFEALGVEEAKENARKRTVSIVVTIGAFLVGAGVFSFVAANWVEMTRGVRLAVILSSMLFSYGAGWYLREGTDLKRTGGALIFLGALIYGAGIFLVAQMFNVRANWLDGFVLWMIGVIAMGLAVGSYAQFYLAAILGVVAVVGYPYGILTGYGYDRFLLSSTFLLFAATVVTFAAGWVIRRKVLAEFKEFY